MTEHSTASVTVMEREMVYVGVEKRATFDAINLPVVEHEKCLSKSLVESGTIWIIFQFWGEKS